MSESKLYRDTVHQVIGGVCYGLGTYLKVDPVVVRIIFVLLAIFGGGGLLIYILLWIFVPEKPSYTVYDNAQNPEGASPRENETAPAQVDPNRGNLIAGIILVAVGALFLVDRFVPRIYFEDLWPLLLIVGGILLLSNHFVKEKNQDNEL